MPFLGLSFGLVPSILIGASAFGASELLLSEAKKTQELPNVNLEEVLSTARKQNEEIASMIKAVEDYQMKGELTNIVNTVTKIIDTVSKKNKTYYKVENLFDYYLPVTLKIVKKYDEIENQRLMSEESKKFMESTRKLISKIKIAFIKQLDGMYQTDIDSADAELKVFDMMLKSDGLNSSDFDIRK